MCPQSGFHSLHDEAAVTLDVDGSLPDWLTGSLVRTGPGAFELPGGSAVDHWFDGLAMCYRFTFDPGDRGQGREQGEPTDAVHYRNRFLRTDAYRDASDGEFTGGFATGETTLRDRLLSLFSDPYDNTNIVVERVGDRYLALTESPRRVVVDPTTLGTRGHHGYDGSDPSGQLACAHLKRDPATGALVNVETAFGRTNRYHVHALTPAGDRRHLGSVETDAPAYMHSFALTPRYVVLTEFPLRVDPTRFLRPGRQPPFIEQFEWHPDRGTRVVVLDRTTGEVVASPTTDPVFGFHHVNAFERDGGRRIVFDLETVPDASGIGDLYLDELRDGDLGAIAGRLERFTVDLQGDRYGVDGATVARETLYADGTALPTASPGRWCRPHRYVYAMSMAQPATDWAHGVLKIDTETGAVIEHTDGGAYFGEPIFVPDPDPDSDSDSDSGSNGATDDGVVLTVALDPGADRSRLLVLDGETLTERARATLPHAAPFDFHGRYFPEITVAARA
ncbi:carotenoid oxygenase family protein [Haloplanus sp.]|uniref:carotenoid oxygenase family protein n=1 Tax=Haloplanus sp. TaxID=1961696 RepID=UPI00261DAD60|nr:carotenoid oxygenase family protein [Haloplanus sp.]